MTTKKNVSKSENNGFVSTKLVRLRYVCFEECFEPDFEDEENFDVRYFQTNNDAYEFLRLNNEGPWMAFQINEVEVMIKG